MFKAAAQYNPDTGTVSLPIDPLDLVQPRTALLHESLRFDPSDDLHVTLIGRHQAAALKTLGASDRVGPILERLPHYWRLQPLGRWYLLHEPHWQAPGGADRLGRASLIERVHCAEGKRFFVELSRQCGQEIPVPPLHITRFVHGDHDGIALPDQATLERIGTPLEDSPLAG